MCSSDLNAHRFLRCVALLKYGATAKEHDGYEAVKKSRCVIKGGRHPHSVVLIEVEDG